MIKIATLRAAGLSDEQVLKVLELHEAEEAARKRELTRQRVRQHRQSKKESKINDHVTQNSVTGAMPTAFPTSFEPDMGVLTLADRLGLDQKQLALEIERFRDYYQARATVLCDWQAAFRSWLNSPFFAKGRANGNGPKYLDAWDAAYAKLDAAIASERAAAGPEFTEAIPF